MSTDIPTRETEGLLPCPFCDEKPYDSPEHPFQRVRCQTPGCPMFSILTGGDEWNTRPARDAALREALEKYARQASWARDARGHQTQWEGLGHGYTIAQAALNQTEDKDAS